MTQHPDIKQAPAWFENTVQVFVALNQARAVAIQDETACGIFDSTASGKPVDLLEDILKLLTGQRRLRVAVVVDLVREHGRKSIVAFDQLGCYSSPLSFVRVQEHLRVRRDALQVICELPSHVVGIHHRNVHALAGLWRVRVAS